LNQSEEKMTDVDHLLTVTTRKVLRLLHGKSKFLSKYVKINIHT